MDSELCAICQDNIAEGDGHALQCGHMFHVNCVLNSAYQGHIACCVCRKFPDGINLCDAQDTLQKSYKAHFRSNLMKYFRKGLAAAKANKAGYTLAKQVKRYETLQARFKKQREDEKVRRKHRNIFLADVRKAISKVKALKKYKKLKVNANTFNVSLRTYDYTPLYSAYKAGRKLQRQKVRIAESMGLKQSYPFREGYGHDDDTYE